MPGMMNTILNLGLNDKSVVGLANATGNERFAYDAYRRLINMFGDVVMGVDHEHFEDAFDKIKKKHRVKLDTDVPTEGLIELCAAYKKVYKKHTGQDFPQDPMDQLELAIEAVFKSWNSDKAISYRRIDGITGLKGTAVNVQTMVFGNMGDDSGTGRGVHPQPLDRREQVLRRVPDQRPGRGRGGRHPHAAARGRDAQVVCSGDKTIGKKVHAELMAIKIKLEKHYKDMQDIEFTIEKGKLFMLQTRTGKRTGPAAVRIACDMVKEKLIDEKTAVRADPGQRPDAAPAAVVRPGRQEEGQHAADLGLPASPGAAVGKLAFTADEAVDRTHAGEKVLLVRKETSPEDVDGMHSAAGILTSTGGMTSHAAVVARGWGKCCVAGAGAIEIDEKGRKITVGGKTFTHKDVLSIDGSTGEVYRRPDADRRAEARRGDFATGDEVGRQVPHAGHPHQRRHAPRTQAGPRVRRRGHRPLPHRAHVLRGRAHPRHAGDDPGRRRRGPRGGPQEAAAVPAEGLRRHLQGDERPAGDDPAARPAAARVPAPRREGPG